MGLNFYISFLVILEYNGNNTINFILDINEISQTEEHRVMPAVCMFAYGKYQIWACDSSRIFNS